MTGLHRRWGWEIPMGSLDLPEYFPPAGEAPPAAPEMAAAALEMVIFFKSKILNFCKN